MTYMKPGGFYLRRSHNVCSIDVDSRDREKELHAHDYVQEFSTRDKLTSVMHDTTVTVATRMIVQACRNLLETDCRLRRGSGSCRPKIELPYSPHMVGLDIHNRL